VVCGYLNAISEWFLGYPDQALAAMNRALEHARDLAHPFSIGMSLLFSAKLAQLCRDPDTARTHAEEALEIGAAHQWHAVELWCLLPRGWALMQRGEPVAGVADIREAMDRRRRMDMAAVWPWFLTVYAEGCGALGQFGEALRALDEAEDWVQRNDERLYTAEVHRVRGELLLRVDVNNEAEAARCFEHALTTARNQCAKSWELRAAMSLARLRRAQGCPDGARTLLASVYGWFSEGFDTADLRDARMLLDELS
jgi:predicted ATPase